MSKLKVKLDQLFNPKSIAIIGLPKGNKTGKLFLLSLLDQDYAGEIFPINPTAKEIDGLKCYANILDAPGAVDLAIVLVPPSNTLSVLLDCVKKGVKGVVLFTAGYKETGTDQGLALELKFQEISQKSGMRLIGPNGMGLYAPKSGISFFPQLSKIPGPVSLISHSGSLANLICRMGPEIGVFFNKAVSLGNECDLWSADFLDYFGQDPETKVIGAYIEGIKDGKRFLDSLQKTCQKKPVIIWKVGLTTEGAKAASSHTGALSGNPEIWNSVIQQTGAIAVTGFEEWVDTIMGFALIQKPAGDRIAIISGPGALGVSAAEACGKNQLKLVKLSKNTIQQLGDVVPTVGTNLNNPIDVSLTASIDIHIYTKALEITLADNNVDAVLMIGIGLTEELNNEYVEALCRLKAQNSKPILVVKMPGFSEKFVEALSSRGIATFNSAEKAVETYSKIVVYYNKRG